MPGTVSGGVVKPPTPIGSMVSGGVVMGGVVIWRRAAPVLARGPMVWRPATTGRSAAATAAKVAMAPTHRSPAVMAVTAVPVATAGWSVTVGPAVMAVTEPRVPAMPI